MEVFFSFVLGRAWVDFFLEVIVVVFYYGVGDVFVF